MDASIHTYFNVYWHAYRSGYDAGDPLGHGKTEQEAIDDLLKQERERRQA